MKNIFIILTSTIILSAFHFSTKAAADDKQNNDKEQIGRFTLHIVNKGEEHILYRIDTVTGNVSVFNPDETIDMSPEDWKQLGPKMQSKKEEYEKKEKMGLFTYQLPFWRSLPEKLQGIKIQGKQSNKN